jgi:hypothetical protein
MMHKLIDPNDIAVEPTGRNRAQRRADAANEAKPLPKSIWLITKVVASMHLQMKLPVYVLSIERRTQRGELTIYSKEGAAPLEGGLLERMTRPGGGEAAIWTDGQATKGSIGGGYTRHAVPDDWGFPVTRQLEDLEEPRTFQNQTLAEPWRDPASDPFPVTAYGTAEGDR